MIKAVVSFCGPQINSLTMPSPYHSYLVVSSPWQTPDSGIASVVAITLNAPMSRQHIW